MARDIKCHLKGGPRDGDTVSYGQPLPKTLVISSDKGFQDYTRKPGSTTFVHADDIAKWKEIGAWQ